MSTKVSRYCENKDLILRFAAPESTLTWGKPCFGVRHALKKAMAWVKSCLGIRHALGYTMP